MVILFTHFIHVRLVRNPILERKFSVTKTIMTIIIIIQIWETTRLTIWVQSLNEIAVDFAVAADDAATKLSSDNPRLFPSCSPPSIFINNVNGLLQTVCVCPSIFQLRGILQTSTNHRNESIIKIKKIDKNKLIT